MIVAILPKVCINYKNGCRENYETDHQVLDHETNCPFRSIKCPLKGCQDGKSQIIYKDLLDHINAHESNNVLDFVGNITGNLIFTKHKKSMERVRSFSKNDLKIVRGPNWKTKGYEGQDGPPFGAGIPSLDI